MKTRVEQELAQIQWPLPEAPVTLCGVGGTARAFFKICREFYGIPKPQREVDAGYISLVNKKLKSRDFRIQQGVYRATPDRVFAIMPGMLILNQVSKVSCRPLCAEPGRYPRRIYPGQDTTLLIPSVKEAFIGYERQK